MSDGAYRDDHDAALARVDALEQELAEVKAEHQREARGDHARVEQLERELAKVKAERDRIQALAPPPPPRHESPAWPREEDPIDARGKLVAGLVIGSMLFAVIVAVIVLNRSGPDPGARVTHDERIAAQQLERDTALASQEYAVVPCIEEAAAVRAEEVTDEVAHAAASALQPQLPELRRLTNHEQ